MVLDQYAVLNDGDIGRTLFGSVFIKDRCLKDNIIALPFTGRQAGIHQGNGLLIDASGLAVVVGFVL